MLPALACLLLAAAALEGASRMHARALYLRWIHRRGLADDGGLQAGFWPLALVPLALAFLDVPDETIARGTPYSLAGADSRARFARLPDEGGLLPEGILVDTTRCSRESCCTTVRVPMGLFGEERYLPFGHPALRIRFQWEILARPDETGDPPAVKIAASEQGLVSQGGRQELQTFWTRHIFMDGGTRGHADVEMPLRPPRPRLPGARIALFGPLVLVPPGWKVALRTWEALPAATEAPPEPCAQEASHFVAWYGRRQIRASEADFQWRRP